MRFVLFTAALATAACSSTKLPPGCTSADSQAFPTFQACFDEHTQMESFTPARAIEICCIDHPIGSAGCNSVCGATTADCDTYVNASLSPASATANDITQACT